MTIDGKCYKSTTSESLMVYGPKPPSAGCCVGDAYSISQNWYDDAFYDKCAGFKTKELCRPEKAHCDWDCEELIIPAAIGTLAALKSVRIDDVDLPKLFAAFNATDTLRVVPAVRSVGGNCVDEKGCDAEKTIACAMKLCGTRLDGATNGCAVDFVACADETDWSTAPKLAAACAAKAGVSADDVMTCFASSEATDLLTEAATLFNAQYPGSAYIPAVAIADKALTSPTYDKVVAGACAAGSTAKVCSSVEGGAAGSCVV